MALFVVFTVNCKLEIIEPVYPFETIWGCVFMQFAYAFTNYGFGDLLEFAAVILLLKYLDDKKVKHDIFAGIIAAFLASIYLICVSFREYDEMTLITSTHFQKMQSVLYIIGLSILIYEGIRILFWLLDNIRNNIHISDLSINRMDNSNKVWLYSGIAIFICWIPWMIMDYPGSFCVDSIDQLKQFFGTMEWSTHHPPFSTTLLGLLTWIGKIIGSTNLGIFLYVLLHTVSGAVIFSYEIKKIYEWGLSKSFIIISTCFFALVPIWGCYVQCVEKSFLYNELISLFVVYIADALLKKEISRKKAILMVISGIIACLIRNNGIYTIIPTLIILLFYFSKENRKHIIYSLCSIVIVYMLVTKGLYPALSIKSGSAAEMFSVPFMQTARYVYVYGDQVTDEEKTAIGGVLWYDAIAERYESQKDISDSVKMLYSGDNSKLKPYFITWIKMFFKHPNVYISAFINNNYGYMAPVIGGVDVNIDYGEEEWLSSIGVRHIFKEMPIKLFNGIHTGMSTWPIFKYFTMGGTYTWLIIIMMLYTIKRKIYDVMPVLIPSILTILICFAGPSHVTLRYMACVTAVIPMYFAYLIKGNEQVEESDSGTEKQ